MLYVLIVLQILEWVLISQPIVEVGSTLFGMEQGFTVFELQGTSFFHAVIVILHIVSLAVTVIPVVKKEKEKGIYYIPAIVTSLTDAFLYIQVAVKLDSLIADTMLGELIQFASVDVSMTAMSTSLIIISAISCVVAVRMVLRAKRHGYRAATDSTQEDKKAAKWNGPLFEKGNIREAAIVLVATCLVVSLGLAIPAAIRSIMSKSIVSAWYLEGSKKGDSPVLVFHSDKTCEVYGFDGIIEWSIENGKLEIKASNGHEATLDYEWDDSDLLIEGIRFTRSPGG